MKGDFSRSTFDPQKPRTSVRMQQGRVLVDADWNEQVDLRERLRRLALRDLVGSSGVPASEPDSFRVAEVDGTLEVEGGRIWVDGLLCEAESIALDESEQPDDPGAYAVVLEAWERHLTAIEDPSIREVALGGPDTSTRTETVCRLRLLPVEAASCDQLGALDYGDGTGQMAARTRPPVNADDPCIVPAQAGYTGLENHLYRIEVHRGGDTESGAAPTFKWSRDNGSVLAAWLSRSNDQLTIDSLGRDSVRGFHDVEWVELGDDALDLRGEPGPLVAIDGVDPAADGEGGVLRVAAADVGQLFDPELDRHPKVRRWDSGPIEIEAGTWQPLGEHHVEVRFAAGTYRAGEFWWVPARAFVGEHFGSIEWPTTLGQADDVDAHGPRRARSRLAVVRFDGEGLEVLDDCRCVFPPLCRVEGDGCCCTITVGGQSGDVDTIRAALAALPATGGTICLREGVYRESVVVEQSRVTFQGCGRRSVWMDDGTGAPALTLGLDAAGGGLERIRVHDLAFEVQTSAIVAAAGAKHRQVRLENLWISARDRSAVVLPRILDLEIRECTVHYENVDRDEDSDSPPAEPALFVGGRRLRLQANRVVVEDRIVSGPVFDGGGIPGGGGFAGGGGGFAGASIHPATPVDHGLFEGGLAGPGAAPDPRPVAEPDGSDLAILQVIATRGRPGLMAGGIQVAGRSQDVELRANHIEGGAWHGIVLGSTSRVPYEDDGDVTIDDWLVGNDGRLEGPGVAEMRAHFSQLEIEVRPAPIYEYEGRRYLNSHYDSDNQGTWISDGPLRDVRLVENTVRGMGGCGIAAAHFFPLDHDIPDLVSVEALELRANRITGCLRLEPWFEAFQNAPATGFGAVALSHVRRLRAVENVLSGNAAGWRVQPVCGVFVQSGVGLRFEGNTIIDNGGRPVEDLDLDSGPRGGIVVQMVTVETYRVDLADAAGGRRSGRRQAGIPALVVHDNVVVSPQGRALEVLALGPVSITDNQLTCQGSLQLPTAFRSRGGQPDLGLGQAAELAPNQRAKLEMDDFRNVLGGAAVLVVDLGTSSELYVQALGFSSLGRTDRLAGAAAQPNDPSPVLVGGNLLFADNQVVLDGFGPGESLPLSSITLVTLGDLALHGNQSDCDMPPGEAVVTNLLALGWSLRTTDNRCTEPLAGAMLSGVTMGVMNRTTFNQGTHCFLGTGAWRVSRVVPNESLVEMFAPSPDVSPCAVLQGAFGGQAVASPAADAATGPADRVGGIVEGASGGLARDLPISIDDLVSQLRQAPGAADRLRLAGLDRLEEATASYRGQAALAVVAEKGANVPMSEAVQRFGRLDRARREIRGAIFDNEAGVVAGDGIVLVGRVVARSSPGPSDRLSVVVARIDEWKNPLASAEVVRGRYSVEVDEEAFLDYFDGQDYLELSLLDTGSVVGQARQRIDVPRRPLRRLDVERGAETPGAEIPGKGRGGSGDSVLDLDEAPAKKPPAKKPPAKKPPTKKPPAKKPPAQKPPTKKPPTKKPAAKKSAPDDAEKKPDDAGEG